MPKLYVESVQAAQKPPSMSDERTGSRATAGRSCRNSRTGKTGVRFWSGWQIIQTKRYASGPGGILPGSISQPRNPNRSSRKESSGRTSSGNANMRRRPRAGARRDRGTYAPRRCRNFAITFDGIWHSPPSACGRNGESRSGARPVSRFGGVPMAPKRWHMAHGLPRRNPRLLRWSNQLRRTARPAGSAEQFASLGSSLAFFGDHDAASPDALFHSTVTVSFIGRTSMALVQAKAPSSSRWRPSRSVRSCRGRCSTCLIRTALRSLASA